MSKKIPKLGPRQHWVVRKDGVVQRYTFKGKKRLVDYEKTGQRKGRAFIYSKKKEFEVMPEKIEEALPVHGLFRFLVAVGYSSEKNKNGLEELRVWVHEEKENEWTNRALFAEMWDFAVGTIGLPPVLINSAGEIREEMNRKITPNELLDENENEGKIGVVYGYVSIRGYQYKGNNAGGQWRFKRV